MLWYRSTIWLALLPVLLLLGAGRLHAQSGSAANVSSSPSSSAPSPTASPPQSASSDFETFVLPSPNPPRPAPAQPAASTSTTTISPITSNPSVAQDYLGAQVALTLFPGESSLGLGVAGNLSGEIIQSQMNPLQWRQGNYANSGFIQVTHNGQGVRLGDTISDQFGNTQSLRLFGLGNSSTGSIGLGLYHGLSDENPFSGSPSIDDDWHVGKGLDTDFLAAADSSWRLSQKIDSKTLQLAWFTGHDSATDRMESGLFASGQPDHLTVAYSNLEAWSGNLPGFDWSLGGARRVGKLSLGIDNTLMREDSTVSYETGLGLIMPTQTGAYGLRVQHGVIDPQEEFGIGNEHSTLAYASYNRIFSSAFSLSLSAGASAESGTPTQKFVEVGGQRALTSRWSLYADITQRLDTSQRQVQIAVGCRLNDEWQVRLLCGPSGIATADGQEPQALGIQIMRSLNVRHIPSGTVTGQILLDGASYEKSVSILLDGNPAAKCSHGQFKITHVLPGPHTVSIAATSLPADLCPDSFSVDVEVKAGKTSNTTFTIHRVGEIEGNIRVLPDPLGQTDYTAAIGVTISAGDNYATTTDQNGNFVLGDLPAGTYAVTLDAGTIPPDYQVVGPASVQITFDPDHPVPAVQFTIGLKHAKVQFEDTNPPAAVPPAKPAVRRVAPASPHVLGKSPSGPARRASNQPIRRILYQGPAEASVPHSAAVHRARTAACPSPRNHRHGVCAFRCPYRCCCGCQARLGTLPRQRLSRSRRHIRRIHRINHGSHRTARRRRPHRGLIRWARHREIHRATRRFRSRRRRFICRCPHPLP